jgi:hypothetical protein
VSLVEKAAIIFSPTPNRPRCCFSTYFPEVRKEQTATGTLSDGTPMPLSSQDISHISLSGSNNFKDNEIIGKE